MEGGGDNLCGAHLVLCNEDNVCGISRRGAIEFGRLSKIRHDCIPEVKCGSSGAEYLKNDFKKLAVKIWVKVGQRIRTVSYCQ